MKIFCNIALLAAVGAAYARAVQRPHTLVVRYQACSDRFFPGVSFAQQAASRMFTPAGIELRWEKFTGERDSSTDRVIYLVYDCLTWKQNLPGALAASLPFADDGIRVRIFLDRVWNAAGQENMFAVRLLGHVLAHEIAHVLQRTDGHSAEGIMKAQWSTRDQQEIRRWGLNFSEEDLAAIGDQFAHPYMSMRRR